MAAERAGADDVEPQKEQHDEREEQTVAVIVIENPRKSRLTVVAAALQLLDGAGGWIPEKGPEVGLSIVIATAARAQRDHRQERDQDAEDRDVDQTEAEPGRKERRQIRIV